MLGQSSGATQIFGLLASLSSKGLFHAAIALSGSPNISMDLHAAEQQGVGFVNNTHCNIAANVTECLYNLSMDEVQNATSQLWANSGDFRTDSMTPAGVALPGLVIVDGVTVQLVRSNSPSLPLPFLLLSHKQSLSKLLYAFHPHPKHCSPHRRHTELSYPAATRSPCKQRWRPRS